jgi:hypothetical protein
MVSSSKMEIKKFNGQSFELWKLSRWKIYWWIEISGSWWIVVLHLHELQQMIRKSWIGRRSAQSDYVSQIQYY